MFGIALGDWNMKCPSLICTDLRVWAATKYQSVVMSCVIPGTPSCTQAFGFCLVGFFGVGFGFFFQEVLISLNKIRYSLVQQQNCVHDVLQWTKIWCYHRLEKSIMYAYFPSLKLKLLMWKMTENCLGVGGVQTGSFGLKMCHLFFLWQRILFK